MMRSDLLRSRMAVVLTITLLGTTAVLEAVTVAPDRLSFDVNGETWQLPYKCNTALSGVHEEFTHAVVVIHGNLRNGVTYYDDMEAAAVQAGAQGYTHIIAPQFLIEADAIGHGLPADILFWADESEGKAWKRGDQASNPGETLSSYAVVDEILFRLAEVDPNLEHVVIVGHSAGGQFVNRYAAGSQAEDVLGYEYPWMHVRYVVANPGSYLYLNPDRHVGDSLVDFAVPTGLSSSCASQYDAYRYGLSSDLNVYMAAVGVDTIRAQFATRDVVYLLGDDDTDVTTGCTATTQGDHRFERGTIYFNYLGYYYGAGIYDYHKKSIVAGVGHDHNLMFLSPCGQFVIFGVGNCPYADPTFTLLTPSGGTTIQAAIDNAVAGDVIALAVGTYTGSGNRGVDFGGKAVKVMSLRNLPFYTIVDCEQVERGFRFISGEGADSVLKGIMIGRGDSQAACGGGIMCSNSSSPTIENCVIGSCQASWYGGGVAVDSGCHPVFTDCLFLGNSTRNAAGEGGAVWGTNGGAVTLMRCTLWGNAAASGGALHLSGTSTPFVSRSVINYTTQGGAVACQSTCVPTFTCCDIYDNTGGDWTGLIASQLGTNYNVQVDPLFCDVINLNFHVAADSVCSPAMSPCSLQIGAKGVGCEERAAIPSITDEPDGDEVCVGDAVTLSVTATGTQPLSYQWQHQSGTWNDISGATGSSYDIAAAAVAHAGHYRVMVSNYYGTVYSIHVELAVDEPAEVTGDPDALTVCADDTATFTVAADHGTATAPLTYQWRKNGANLSDGARISGATTDTLDIDPVITDDAADYDVVVTNRCGADTSATAALTVNMAPTITQHPQTQQVAVGSPVTFTASAQGTPAPAYQWRKNGTNLPGATGSSYTISSVDYPDEGNYDVVVTNSCGSDTSQVAALLVVTPAQVTDDPEDQTICEGDSTSFVVEADGTPPMSYQWRKDGQNISGANNRIYAISDAQAGDAGSYDCVVSNNWGSDTSAAATLTVQIPVTITIEPTDQDICDGDAAVFTVDADGDPAPTYQWRRNGLALSDGGAISGALTATLTVDPVLLGDDATFDVAVTNPCSAEASVAVQLTVRPTAVTVPDDYPTIQAAVAAICPSRGVLTVRDGIYTAPGDRNVDLSGKAISIVSESGIPELCVIDCQGQGRGFIFQSGEQTDSVLEGFTITNGNVLNEGGAIRSRFSSPTIRNCVLSHSFAAQNGGAFAGDGFGGILDGCTIFANTAAGKGGGLYFGDNSEPQPGLLSCTLHGNGAPVGGGVCIEEYSYVDIQYTIIALALQGVAVHCDGTSAAMLSCSDVFGNPGGDWVNCITGQDTDPTRLNLWADPMFCGPAEEDFRLHVDSPCIAAPGCALMGALGPGCGYPPGDCNLDGRVSYADWLVFNLCYLGPGVAHGGGCGCAEIDGDLDVDLLDTAVFQTVFTGD